ncbi:MAG TPA: aminotransferase class IV [Chryseolinea sp.]
MSLLIESIKLLDGEYYNLSYHERRMNRALKELCGAQGNFDLEEFLTKGETPKDGLYKCRILYDKQSKEIELIPYQAREIRSLKIVEQDSISYEFKYTDRRAIDALFELRMNCDDILIVKGGMVTDSSFANIVFKRGNNWYTPSTALLKGTMRSKLLERNIIQEDRIHLKNIYNFEKFKLINAMLEFDSPEQDLSNIVF